MPAGVSTSSNKHFSSPASQLGPGWRPLGEAKTRRLSASASLLITNLPQTKARAAKGWGTREVQLCIRRRLLRRKSRRSPRTGGVSDLIVSNPMGGEVGSTNRITHAGGLNLEAESGTRPVIGWHILQLPAALSLQPPDWPRCHIAAPPAERFPHGPTHPPLRSSFDRHTTETTRLAALD